MIRGARRGDILDLLLLIQEHAAFERSTATLSAETLAQLLETATPPTRLVVAEEANELVGYAALTFDYALWQGERYGHLDCLFVRGGTRGRGVGKRLFAHVADLARAIGARRLEWQTPDWNEDAARFYAREGGVARAKMRFTLDL